MEEEEKMEGSLMASTMTAAVARDAAVEAVETVAPARLGRWKWNDGRWSSDGGTWNALCRAKRKYSKCGGRGAANKRTSRFSCGRAAPPTFPLYRRLTNNYRWSHRTLHLPEKD